ncbi:aldo/keto reductase [Pseudanabaena sp. FACHB-2040]|uniref:aldo/keto reductase n=1 Tax=Pseudanabaena sp. FACHB-2040 TaxID=2692859 RepID=UPI0016828413|nr:aldo/keto reductase [Pseudanabaena sp. FACHB-2040]MBD2258595.1 aldo/keto reductase [Pseudanabaena sp. FACHB-2040]
MDLTTIQGQPASRLGLAGQKRMEPGCVDLAWQAGINYFFSYGLGKGPLVEELRSHLQVHRDHVMVATGTESRSLSETERHFDQARQKLAVDSLDVFFLEYVSPTDDWHELRALLDRLYDWKAAGQIRYVGISTHNRPIALRIIQEGLCDVLMHRYNMAHRGAEAAVLPAAEAAGMPVITFTSTRWGTLLKGHPSWPHSPPSAADCYRFCLSQPAVRLALTSPQTHEQLRANLAALTTPVMTQEEQTYWQAYGDLIYGQGNDAYETSWP